ncbi:MAG: hypothetical protein L6R41_001725 [Letrouitia leprolyta]|nr:MAG: hypothetical protein L6R41_001725 [Letrouitia leprolyta]
MDNHEDDERIRRSGDSRRINEPEVELQTSIKIDKGFMRKPLENGPHQVVKTEPTVTPILHPHQRNPLNPSHGIAQIARKPVGNNVQPKLDATSARSKPPNAHIMGPRAMHGRLHSDHSPDDRLSHSKENLMPRRWSEQSPILQPSSIPKSGFPSNMPNHTHNTHYRDPRSVNRRTPSPPKQEVVSGPRPSYQRKSTDCEHANLSLTLIRRYNGNQWNVGKISSTCDRSSLWESHSTTQSDDLSIHISSPGYTRFWPSNAPGTSAAADDTFERHLTKLRRRSQGTVLSENNANTINDRRSLMGIDFRRLSKPKLENPPVKAMDSKPSPENKSTNIKGYGFYSPWNGTCEFFSGISGHTLKCKHTAPSENSQAATVSELRFNLPTSSSTSVSNSRDLGKRSSYFSSKQGSELYQAEEHIPEPSRDNGGSDPFGLYLGQEHAGGGFGGKKAKLGKLIIEPEGLKMLDLLVAANMGLWWKVYEKSA